MVGILGYLMVIVCVFGGYILAGGKIDIIIHALPFEFMIIGGSGIGAFLVANGMQGAKHSMKEAKLAFKKAKWTKQDYIDLLSLLFTLTRLMKTKGMVAVEQHVESPKESEIFASYPKIINDHHLITFICDNVRMFTMDMTDPNEFEDAMMKQIDKITHEEMHPAHAFQTMADGFPALGIVAAVMGVIKTMASIDQPPAILGKMIGSALVGTFLGVLLSYGFVGPLASRVKMQIEEQMHIYYVVRDVLLAYLRGNAVQICVELGRGSVPSHIQPTFYDIEKALEDAPKVG